MVAASPTLSAFFYPALYAFILYGVRFTAFAAIAFTLADPSRLRMGRTHIARPSTFRPAPHVKRELAYSLLSLLVFALVNGTLYASGLLRQSRLYLTLDAYPLWWFWASIPVMVLLHDTLFYCLHRAMHTKLLFASMHRLHHRSLCPTAFAAYSFSCYETFAEALIVTAILYLIPVHPLAFFSFQTISTAYNVYGHCGTEFYPQATPRHWLGRWLNTSTLHEHHHRYGHGNYSFYFTVWDRIMGTLEPDPAATRRDLTQAGGPHLTGRVQRPHAS